MEDAEYCINCAKLVFQLEAPYCSMVFAKSNNMEKPINKQ